MLGAIIGDIVGSRFEFNNHKSKEFELFTDECEFTDDTILTLAVAKSVLENKDIDKLAEETTKNMVLMGRKYPHVSWGGSFLDWLFIDHTPYNSCGNGAAMRVSICGWVGETINDVKRLSYEVTRVSHNHFEGIKGAECVAVAIWMARHKYYIRDIRDMVATYYQQIYRMTIPSEREKNMFDEVCQLTVPRAMLCFLESNSFEDAIRNAISIGGDSDTIATITGSVAEAYYGIPKEIEEKAKTYLPKSYVEILDRIEHNI